MTSRALSFVLLAGIAAQVRSQPWNGTADPAFTSKLRGILHKAQGLQPLPLSPDAVCPRARGKEGCDHYYPDPALTPGVANPNVTPENIHETICVSGWTATVRPPSSYTTRLKKERMLEFGLPGATGDYEADHWIPLEIGGHPTDPANFFMEPYCPVCEGGETCFGAREKDKVETNLKRRVCSGELGLREAQRIIVEDWYAEYLNIRAADEQKGKKRRRPKSC